MQPSWEKVERINTKLIPAALVLLLFIIFYELVLHKPYPHWELAVTIIDYLIITIFVIDLIFLAIKARTTRYFFRHYWLDILAVFPFGLLFKAIEQVFRGIQAAERLVIAQAVLHEALEVEKEARLATRGERLAKFLRIGTRGIRFLSKSHFFGVFSRKEQEAKRKVYRKKKKSAQS